MLQGSKMHPRYLNRVHCLWAPVVIICYWCTHRNITGSGRCFAALGKACSPPCTEAQQKNDACPHDAEQKNCPVHGEGGWDFSPSVLAQLAFGGPCATNVDGGSAYIHACHLKQIVHKRQSSSTHCVHRQCSITARSDSTIVSLTDRHYCLCMA